jgi:hypothetical protein
MIGESVYSTSRTPKIVTFGGPLACILVVASYSMGMVGLRVFAILPAAMAVMSALSIRAAFKAEITKDALEVETGPIILFQQIQGLCIGGVCRNPTEILPAKSIQVFHAEGILEIPSKLNINHSELYRFLYSQLPTTGADHVHRDLRKHLDEQRDVFDQDQIFTFCARRSLATGIQGRYAAGQFFAILVTAIAWAIMAQSREVSDNFTAVAIALGIFGFAGMLISLLSSRGEAKGLKDWRESSLIISPKGIALSQGDIKGILAWEELQSVDLGPGYKGKAMSMWNPISSGLTLKVAGAAIVVHDVYDCPIPIIRDHMLKYWQPSV